LQNQNNKTSFFKTLYNFFINYVFSNQKIILYIKATVVSVCYRVVRSAQPWGGDGEGFFSFLFALNCPGLIMVFKTWFSGLGISTLGPGFSHRGFRVAFGHGHPLVIIIQLEIFHCCWTFWKSLVCSASTTKHNENIQIAFKIILPL
jgi:hypothetical protein